MRGTLIGLLFLLLGCTSTTPPPVVPPTAHLPGYVRGSKTTTAARVIVFVHGVFGDAAGTWTNSATGAYFPALVRDDPAFKDADIWVHEYPSPKVGRSYTIDELADHLDRHLQNDNVIANHRQIIFVAHSMGGIVVRDYLLKSNLAPDRVPLLYFYSTPTTGAEIAQLASAFSNNPQLVDLRPLTTNDPGFLGVIASHWQASPFRATPTNCAYELLPTHGFQIVQRASATHLCTHGEPLQRDHVTIIKPANAEDDSYIAFRNAFLKPIPASAAPQPTWNFTADDHALLRITNGSKNPDCRTCWSSRATVVPGDTISVDAYVHNASTTPVYGARIHLTIPQNPQVADQVLANLTAPGTLAIAGSVSFQSIAGPIMLIPTSGTWYPAGTMSDRSETTLPYNQRAEDALGPDGLLLGDISPGRDHEMHLVLRFRCIPATLIVLPDMAAALRSIIQPSGMTPPTSMILPGHLDRSWLDNETRWVSEITNIPAEAVPIASIDEYNDTTATLHNVTAAVTRTPTPMGEELHVRISADNVVRRTATATLSYKDPHASRSLFAITLLRFKAANPSCAECAHSAEDAIRTETMLGDEVDGPIPIGDIPPKTGVVLVVGIAPDQEPTGAAGDELARLGEAMEQILVDKGLTGFDLTLVVSRNDDRKLERAATNVRAGERITLLAHFANGGTLPLRAARAVLALSRDGNMLTATLTLRGTNTPAQATNVRITFAPEHRDAQLRYERASRSSGEGAFAPIDAQRITGDGIDLGDLAASEYGWLRIVYVVIPGAAP